MSTEDDIPENGIGDDEVSALYRKADTALPPESLDESILATAHRAVERGHDTHKSARAPFSGHWPVAVSAAAVFIIAVILAPSLEKHAPIPDATPPDNRQALREQADATNAVHEPPPAAAPVRAQQPQTAPEKSLADEDRTAPAGLSGTTGPAPDLKTESRVPRARARLNAAGGAPLAIFTPEMWLLKIQQLIDSGRIAEARDELDRFRQAHPDYELDQNLLERLKQP